MQIVKYTHACVRITDSDRVLVIDPGIWSEPQALAGADAVLITHEHADHIDVLRLAGIDATVYVPAGARIAGLEATHGLRVVHVTPGEQFTAAGFPVCAVGGRHAAVHPAQQPCANLGYILDETLYHPGDALHVPEQPVETLLVPVQASWMRLGDALQFARAIGPRRAVPIHEGQLNTRGQATVADWLASQLDGYRWLVPGEAL